MDCVEKNQFLLRWRIKNFLDTDIFKLSGLWSPQFEAKNFRDSKWKIHLGMCDCSKTEKDHLEIELCFIDYDLTLVVDGKLSLNFRFKILSGEFSIDTSVFNYSFEKGTDSLSYPLIDIDDLYRQMRISSEDTIIVMCYMEIAKNASSPMVHETQDIDCEAETIFANHSRSFDCCFKIKNYDNWKECKQIFDLSIWYELTLKYVQNIYQVECLLRMNDDWEHKIGCRIYLISAKDEKIPLIDNTLWFVNNKKVCILRYIHNAKLKEAGCFTNKEIILRGKFERIYSEKVSYSKNNINCENKSVAAFNTCSFVHLQRDFRNLLVAEHFVDMKLRVDNEIFRVHKGILASRSPVFLAMFNHDMVESSTGVVDIYDIDTRNIKLFLEFIYTGEIREIDEEIAMSMLMLADKYQVTSLKDMSSKFLMSVLSTDNACDILSAADLVNCDDLKLSAVEYIAEHSKLILASPDWSTWAKNNIALATEVFLSVSNKFENS